MTDTEQYYDEYWRRDRPSPLEDTLAPERLRILRHWLGPDVEGWRALDAGAGGGDTVAALTALGIDVSGMDVSSEATELATKRNPGLPFFTHSVEEPPWPVEPGSLDLVVTFEVIEHLLRPRRLLEGAAHALRPGGRLALTTPYHGLAKNLALAVAAFDRHFAVEGDHIRFFSDRALRQLAEEEGFRVERIVHYGRRSPFSAGSFLCGIRR